MLLPTRAAFPARESVLPVGKLTLRRCGHRALTLQPSDEENPDYKRSVIGTCLNTSRKPAIGSSANLHTMYPRRCSRCRSIEHACLGWVGESRARPMMKHWPPLSEINQAANPLPMGLNPASKRDGNAQRLESPRGLPTRQGLNKHKQRPLRRLRRRLDFTN